MTQPDSADSVDRFATLVDGPSPATLTTYRKHGSAVGSPVWFRRHGETLEVIINEDDVKLRHLTRHPQCALLIFEAVPPFRGVRVEGAPTVTRDDVTPARLAIAVKYLGAEQGRRFTEVADRDRPAVVVSPPTRQGPDLGPVRHPCLTTQLPRTRAPDPGSRSLGCQSMAARVAELSHTRLPASIRPAAARPCQPARSHADR